MHPTATVDATRFNDQIARVHSALIGAGKMGDAATVVEDETRRFLKQVMRFTPPKSLAQGRKAVARDIRRAMTPVDPEFFTNPELKHRIRAILSQGYDTVTTTRTNFGSIKPSERQKAARTSAFVALSGLIGNANGWKKWKVRHFDRSLHTKARDNRGRVNRTKRVFVMEAGAHKKYVREVQSRVGLMKSGWAPALRSVGGAGEIPSWVARHTRNPGFVVNNLGNSSPSVTVGNVAKGVGQIQHFVRGALNARVNAMRRNIRLILSDYSKDVAQGMRVTRKARRTGGD